MRERVIELMNALEITPYRFAATIGVKAANISHILSGRNNPSLDFVQNVLRAFPNVNTDWLIMGSGTMFRNDVSNAPVALNQPKLFEEEPTTLTLASNSNGQQENEAVAPNIAPEFNESSEQKQSLLDDMVDADNKLTSDIERIMIFYKDKRVAIYRPE